MPGPMSDTYQGPPDKPVEDGFRETEISDLQDAFSCAVAGLRTIARTAEPGSYIHDYALNEIKLAGLLTVDPSLPKTRAAVRNLGMWMSAALEDPLVCFEMKVAVEAWFDAMPSEWFKP